MKFYEEKDYDALSRRAANIIAAQMTLKPDCVLGLATGSSPIGTYKCLIEKYENGDIDFSQVKTANLDEYKGLTRDNDQSYYYFGLGHNGHIGYNEPAADFPQATHCVDLQERTIEANKRFFASADDVPRQAYTMGIGTIMRAKKILLVVSGQDKAETVAKAFFGPVTPEVPASILQFHPDVTIVGDHAAFSKIPR